MSGECLSVSQALSLAKEAIEEGIGPLWVEGELSGFKRHSPSGHLYFDLKDARGRISCVMWRAKGARLRFEPVDGMQIRANGRLGIYEVQGRLQLYVESLEPAGLGELQAALERLKARLAEEGLFDLDRKRPLPKYPEQIGVVTSSAGAAVRDIFRVLEERWPIARIVFRPCAVQGEGAGEQIALALDEVQGTANLDLILLGRGGGSIEDLWSFNEEVVVRAVASAGVPVVTGIGHEIDVTLADLVADLRAATPSQAAELAVPDSADVLRTLGTLASRLRHHADGRIDTSKLQLSRLEGSHGLRKPIDLVRTRVMRIDDLGQRLTTLTGGGVEDRRRRMAKLIDRWSAQEPATQLRRSSSRLNELNERLARAILRALDDAREKLRAKAGHLAAVGPQSVLSRGYSICLRPRDGKAVRAWSDVGSGEKVEVVLGSGALGCTVDERKKEWKMEAGR